MTQDLISIQNVSCVYSVKRTFFRSEPFVALKDISFGIEKGTTIGILGRNGAGKSTLLRIIAGIILPTSGTVTFHKKISVSLLAMQLGFAPRLTGRQNAIMGALLLGYSKREAEELLDKVIDFSELGEWIDEPIRNYSSGMRARLGFSIALEMTPDVVLVDEILGVGDESFRKKSTKKMKDKINSGQTVVFVSHNGKLHRELCSSLIWIEKGIIKAQGDTDTVLRRYQRSLKNKPILHF